MVVYGCNDIIDMENSVWNAKINLFYVSTGNKNWKILLGETKSNIFLRQEHKINFLNSFICAKQNDFVIHTFYNLLLILENTK